MIEPIKTYLGDLHGDHGTVSGMFVERDKAMPAVYRLVAERADLLQSLRKIIVQCDARSSLDDIRREANDTLKNVERLMKQWKDPRFS